MQQYRIRRARPEEAGSLSDLALRSKAHWPYSPEFLEACRAALTLTAEYIRDSEVWVYEARRCVIGFYGFEPEDEGIGLAYFFVQPDTIRSGVGKALWAHAVSRAARLGYRWLFIESDPHAEGFYQAMGAERIGDRPSSVDAQRCLPLLRFTLSQKSQM